MKNNTLILIPSNQEGNRNPYLKELIEDFLPNNGYKMLDGELPYLCAYIEINVKDKTFQAKIENSESGPMFFLGTTDEERKKVIDKTKQYILGDWEKREAIIERLNDKIEIDFIGQLNHSSIFKFVMFGYALSSKDNFLNLNGNESVIFAYDKELKEYVGCLVIASIFSSDMGCNLIINFGYVDEEYRNQGIFTNMINFLFNSFIPNLNNQGYHIKITADFNIKKYNNKISLLSKRIINQYSL